LEKPSWEKSRSTWHNSTLNNESLIRKVLGVIIALDDKDLFERALPVNFSASDNVKAVKTMTQKHRPLWLKPALDKYISKIKDIDLLHDTKVGCISSENTGAMPYNSLKSPEFRDVPAGDPLLAGQLAHIFGNYRAYRAFQRIAPVIH
jgi:hypothetical protein